VRIGVVVIDLGQIFSGSIQRIRKIVVSCRDNQLPRTQRAISPKLIFHADLKIAILPAHTFHALILPNIQLIVLSNLAVVLQSLIPVRFLVGRRKRNIANLKQFRRGEKRHVRGIVKERIAKATLIDRNRAKSRPLRLNRASQSCRSRPDHQYVEDAGVGAV
jgi:hypothetical protein